MRKTTQNDIEASRSDFEELSRVLSRLDGGKAVAEFLCELCTPTECLDLARRWLLVKELLRGKTQRTVARELGMSLCRITRGAHYVKNPDSILARSAGACIKKGLKK